MTRVSIFMPSFNKPGYVVQGIKSVLEQTSSEWELWVLDNSMDSETRLRLAEWNSHPQIRILCLDINFEVRAVKDVPVYLCNKYYPEANGDIIIYMSDDDLLAPRLVERVIQELDDNSGWEALYWNSLLAVVHHPEDHPTAFPWLSAGITRGRGRLDSQVDGGQVAIRKNAFERLSQPWYPEDLSLGQNTHSDGVLMEKLASTGVEFHPVNFDGLIHRRTPLSTYTRS